MNWHLIIEAGYTEFEVAQQLDRDDNEVDLGTSIDGKYYYVMPVFYYSPARYQEDGFRGGVGLGLASLEATGTAIYDRSGEPTTVHNIAVDDAGLIFHVFAAYQRSGLHVGVSLNGTGSEGGDSQNPNNNYALLEFGIDIGYSVYF